MNASHLPLILFDEDTAILRRLLDDITVCHRAKALIRRKIATARVVDASSLPGNVATINSRVAFQVGSDLPTTADLVNTGQSIRLFQDIIPLRSLVGLAVLGLQEGDVAVFGPHQNPNATLSLKRVLHQPQRGLTAIFGSALSSAPSGTARGAAPSGNFERAGIFSFGSEAAR
ncbi:hypothetical protein [Neorhizobium sp. T25_13]|uniref:hypothetical protein n=1 Tax=Neorhizobium sp. T25_13 TaxID=2093830 RepID=UPI000CF9B477|nr:hypothetical protein [Neorhizobium sp. T25_13]